jgi:hypothetical protein
MKSSNQRSFAARCSRLAALLATAPLLVAGAAHAAPPPDPCKLVTVAEMQQIMGPLKGAPKGTDPKSGEISCTYTPVQGPSFVEVTLNDGDLPAWKKRNGGKSPVAVPEFGADAFINPDFEGWADLYAKKGGLVLRVTMPKGAQSMEAVKAIARKALPRL